VTDITSDSDTEIPQWDVALEGLAREAYQKLGQPLRVEDFSQLARQHAIRLDDIMATVFALCLHERWRYEDDQGEHKTFTQDDVDRLLKGSRLQADDLNSYSGGWRPA
jgi:hypothetical protein